MRYVPFIYKNQLRYGYVALNLNKKKKENLEFLLNEKNSIFDFNWKENLIKFINNKILNTILFFVKKNEFTKLISLKESKINFFTYKL